VDLFYPMGPRLTMLLCTVYTQKGEEDFPIFDLLPDDDAYLIQEKAQALQATEGDKRAALVVREIRRQLQFAGLAGLESVDPSWLLAGIKGEQPQTIGLILAQLSGGARSRILAQLPPEVRAKVPGKEDLKQVRLEMMRIVRQQFEAKFVTMPAPPGEPTNFYFKDIALLEARDLVQLVRALGVEQLASAFLTIGKRKLAELCSRLGKQASEELIAALKETDPRDAMDLNDANNFLSRMVLGLRLEDGRNDSVEAQDKLQKELFQKAGLFRLAMAIRTERPTFVQQLAQRIPRTHGRLLRTYVYRIGEEGAPDPVKLRRLQDLVLFRIERLAERGKVNPRYLKFTFCYWGEEQAAEGGEAEG
jgi:hypothetical protein